MWGNRLRGWVHLPLAEGHVLFLQGSGFGGFRVGTLGISRGSEGGSWVREHLGSRDLEVSAQVCDGSSLPVLPRGHGSAPGLSMVVLTSPCRFGCRSWVKHQLHPALQRSIRSTIGTSLWSRSCGRIIRGWLYFISVHSLHFCFHVCCTYL